MKPLATRLARFVPAQIWVVYLPLGMMYLGWVSLLAVALGLPRAGGKALRWWQQPLVLPAGLLAAWLALSALWSSAPAGQAAGYAALYAMVLGVPLIGARVPPAWGLMALRHFCAASGLIALLMLLTRTGLVDPGLFERTSVNAEGNQRIATSLLLALGAAFSLWHATRETALAPRAAWLTLAALVTLAVTMQDRRTGIVLLPLMLVAWALASQRGWLRRAVVIAAILACGALTWQLSDNVRARFTEGLTELRLIDQPGDDQTSWGQRLRMGEITAAMISNRPLVGYGLGSWKAMWQARTPQGTRLHDNSTPHNEYLLLAHQAGLPAVLLLLWLVVAACRHALSAGTLGMPALMLWTALAGAASFNAVLRDGKFALPLFMLGAWSLAAMRVEAPAADLVTPR